MYRGGGTTTGSSSTPTPTTKTSSGGSGSGSGSSTTSRMNHKRPLSLRNNNISLFSKKQQKQKHQGSKNYVRFFLFTVAVVLVIVMVLEWKLLTNSQQPLSSSSSKTTSKTTIQTNDRHQDLSHQRQRRRPQRPQQEKDSKLSSHSTTKIIDHGSSNAGGGSSSTSSSYEGPFVYNTLPPDLTLPTTTYDDIDNNDLSHIQYPDWILNYIKWHQQIRKQYPNMELFTNPNAPNLLIRTCLGLCGGLHDRLGQLPWDLYLANQTNRILLLSWQRPKSIEEFLIPSHPTIFNWTIPYEAQFGFNDMHSVRNHTELFENYLDDHPTDEFWNTQLDLAIQRATIGTFQNIKILRHRILGHLGKDILQKRLLNHYYEENNNGQPIQLSIQEELRHVKLFEYPLFGRIFWQLFFKPHPIIEQQFRTVMSELQLIPQQYTVVHCRVRHPKAFTFGNVAHGKNPNYPADKTGLPWEGQMKLWAMSIASRALQCASIVQSKMGIDVTSISTTSTSSKQQQQQQQYHPIYFMSDSNDLVNHVAHELTNPNFVAAHATNSSNDDFNVQLYHHVVGRKGTGGGLPTTTTTTTTPLPLVVARNVTMENAHIDRQKGRDPPAYYATFIDLLIAMHAKCVIYGIGYYAAFAAHVSGTQCQGVYQKEAWGDQTPKLAYPCTEHDLEEDDDDDDDEN